MQKNIKTCYCTPHAKTQISVFAPPAKKHDFAVLPLPQKNTTPTGINYLLHRAGTQHGGAVRPRTPSVRCCVGLRCQPHADPRARDLLENLKNLIEKSGAWNMGSIIKFFEPMRIPKVTHNDLEPRKGKGGKYYIGKSEELKEAEASWEAHLARYTPLRPLDGPIDLTLVFAFASDKHEAGSMMDKKPDADNLVKVVQDVMGRLRWFAKGDQQIAFLTAMKLWGGSCEGIGVMVEPIDVDTSGVCSHFFEGGDPGDL